VGVGVGEELIRALGVGVEVSFSTAHAKIVDVIIEIDIISQAILKAL